MKKTGLVSSGTRRRNNKIMRLIRALRTAQGTLEEIKTSDDLYETMLDNGARPADAGFLLEAIIDTLKGEL